MRQLFFNQFEKLGFQDLNDLQAAMNKTLSDDYLYNYLGKPTGGVLGSSFTGSYVSALASSIAAGTGYYYDSGQSGYNSKFRMIQSDAAIPVTHTAAHATLNRYDLVCLAPNFIVDTTASRLVKAGGTGPIAAQVVTKSKRDSYTLQCVAGTPSGSPTVPATPAGYIPLYKALITAVTGMSGAGAITDLRNVLTFNLSNAGHTIATSTALQTQLDQLDTFLSADYSASVASTFAKRDASKNFATNRVDQGFQTTVASAGTLTLTAASAPVQHITGSNSHTVKLPDATTLPVGAVFIIKNRQSVSGNDITLKDSAANTLVASAHPLSEYVFTLLVNGTAAGTWDIGNIATNELLYNATNVVARVSGYLTAGVVAGTYLFVAGGGALVASGAGSANPVELLYGNSTDNILIGNLTPKWRLRGILTVNDVAPTGNFTLGLFPITHTGVTGGAGVNIYTAGTVVSGSNGASWSTPAADTMVQDLIASGVSADFTPQTGGSTCIGIVTTATIAASSHVHINAWITKHYA